MTTSNRYESTTAPGVFYWAQANGANCFCVMVQAEGAPASEACDDWPASFADADEIAQQLAKGEL